MKKFLEKFTLFELILLALIAAAGIAVKPVVVAVAHLITGPLFIPGGALAGGFYMLFVVLGGALVRKRGCATLVCLIQAIAVLVSGVYGSHGAASLVTYVVPGLLVDLLWLVCRTKGNSLMACFLGGITANVSGTVLVNFVFFRMPMIPLLFTAVLGAFSGGLGGVITWQIVKHFKKLNFFSHLNQLTDEKR
jgi:ABC-type thiamin/hydroxymethylpyrimidine transport system permease subunit